MERLTFKNGDDCWCVRNEHCYEEQSEHYCGPAIDLLAAYEDTGLTPEKIAGIACELQVYRNAGKDGRLPLLLCKIDDTVYVVLVGRVFPFEVISVMLHGDTPTFKAQHGMHLCWVFGNDDIGKTVFLTHEEAEAALKGLQEVTDEE